MFHLLTDVFLWVISELCRQIKTRYEWNSEVIKWVKRVLLCLCYFYDAHLAWRINNSRKIFPPADVWRLGSEGREVPQQSGPPAPSAPALHRLLLLSSTRGHQPLLSECRHDLLPHSQPRQWLHPHCQKAAQPFPWVLPRISEINLWLKSLKAK